jgi:hypothetical protein
MPATPSRISLSGTTAPVVSTGVQRLNEDLSSIFDRILSVTNRVNILADQFGAPATIENSLPTGPVTSTNEHMGNLDRALLRLEMTIARLDNQG